MGQRGSRQFELRQSNMSDSKGILGKNSRSPSSRQDLLSQ
jgi:hypothetical protein